MAELGDLSAFLKEGGLSNLDWLEVDPEEYRENAVLPRQNLDVGPDLTALWSHDDKPASSYVENKGSLPHTMGDLSQEHGRLRASPDDIVKVARLALMQSTDVTRLRDALYKRFDRDSIAGARTHIAGVLAERGLLGKLYIDASDFQGCDTGASQPLEFVHRYASEAKFVLAKDKCAGCVHAMKTPTGGDTCAVFHKEIKIQVPYSDALAIEVEQMQRAKGKAVQASTEVPRERIRLALLADSIKVDGTPQTPKPIDDVARMLRPQEVHTAYTAPVDLTLQREEAKAAVKTALATGRITVPQAQSAYSIVASATTPYAIETVKATALGLEMPATPVYQGEGSDKYDQLTARTLKAVQQYTAYVRPEDLTPFRREAKKAVDLALSKGSITPAQAQSAYGIISSATGEKALRTIKATALGLEAPEALLYVGSGSDTANPTAVRSLSAVQRHKDYVRPEDLTPMRKAARKAINEALTRGSITVEQAQSAYSIVAGTEDSHVIEVIRAKALGLEAPSRSTYEGVGQQPLPVPVAPEVAQQQLVSVASLTKKRDEEARRLVAAEKAKPIVEIIRREMLKGKNAAELQHTLQHTLQSTDLPEVQPFLEPLLREAGLYGVIYSTQETFEDCREGANFFATYNPGVRGIVAGSKCGGCIYNKMARCLMYGKPLVQAAQELYTQETVDKVAQDYRAAGLQVQTVGANARSVLAHMHNDARTQIIQGQRSPAARLAQLTNTAHQMNRSDHMDRTSALTRREIVKTAQRHLNEGLYGKDLLASLKTQFEVRDIKAAAKELRPVLAEQGLQGIHYIDPTIYEDYGKGCKEASALHRSRLVPYVKVGSKCGSCIHQNKPGHCSVLNKPLVVEPPYIDKAAQQREVLSEKATEISYESLMNNGLTMMAEYQLQHGGFEVEVDDAKVPETLGMEFGQAGQGVRL